MSSLRISSTVDFGSAENAGRPLASSNANPMTTACSDSPNLANPTKSVSARSAGRLSLQTQRLRRRPVGNALLLAGVAVAALGSALAGLGTAQTAAFVAGGAGLLYAGSVVRA